MKIEVRQPAEISLSLQSDSSLQRVGLLQATGVQFPDDTPYEKWLAFTNELLTLDRAAPWFIGDALNFGEKSYKQMMTKSLESDAHSYGYLRNCKYVCKKFPLWRRRETLSFSHHREVAGFSEAEQERLLDIAQGRKDPQTGEWRTLSILGLKDFIREENKKIKERPNPKKKFFDGMKMIDEGVRMIEEGQKMIGRGVDKISERNESLDKNVRAAWIRFIVERYLDIVDELRKLT